MIENNDSRFRGLFNRIVLLSLDAPTTLGMRTILSDLTDTPILTFRTLSDCIDECRNADIICVSQSALIKDMDFFMPRKNRVVVLTDNPPGSSSAFYFLNVNCSEKEFENMCVVMLGSLTPVKEFHSDLSARETDVLREITKGLTNKEIADNLCISVNTVITHRKNISSKLGIRSASGLSLYALMNGIV